jgi:hypothetical protein
MRNIEITPQKNNVNDSNGFEIVDTFSYENESLDTFLLESSGSTDNFEFDSVNKQTEKIRELKLRNTPRDKNIRIDKLLVEVDRTDAGRILGCSGR